MDKLEKFIKSRREAFDTEAPSDGIWARIERELHPTSRDYGWIWKAAVAVLVAVCSFLLWDRSQNAGPETVTAYYYMDPEFEETELYYTRLISEKKRLIENIDLDDPGIKEGFRKDLEALDSLYIALKNEFIETSNAAVVDAMIENLQLRMQILNQQQMILEKLNNTKDNETDNTQYL